MVNVPAESVTASNRRDSICSTTADVARPVARRPNFEGMDLHLPVRTARSSAEELQPEQLKLVFRSPPTVSDSEPDDNPQFRKSKNEEDLTFNPAPLGHRRS